MIKAKRILQVGIGVGLLSIIYNLIIPPHPNLLYVVNPALIIILLAYIYIRVVNKEKERSRQSKECTKEDG